MKKEILMLKKSCHSLFAALCVKKEPLGFCASLWFGGFFNQPFSLYSVCCLATVPMTFSWWDHLRSCWRKCTATDHIHLLMRCVCVWINMAFYFLALKGWGGGGHCYNWSIWGRFIARHSCTEGFWGHCNTADFEKFLFFFQASVYSICLRTCDDGMDGTEVFPDYPDLIADRSVYFMQLSQKAAACEMSQWIKP